MSDAVLVAESRAEKGSGPAGRLRREGRLPAVVYGLDAEPLSVSVSERDLQHILSGEAGANTLITLQLDGRDQLTLARQIQRHPVRNQLLHVDFIRIRADRPVTAEVPLHLVGTAEGISLGGILEQQLFTLSIEAKPADLPNAIEHDISELTLGGQVHVRDLAIPAGVTVLVDDGELVATVAVPRGLAEEEAAAEAGEAVEGEAGEAAEETGAEGESGQE